MHADQNIHQHLHHMFKYLLQAQYILQQVVSKTSQVHVVSLVQE